MSALDEAMPRHPAGKKLAAIADRYDSLAEANDAEADRYDRLADIAEDEDTALYNLRNAASSRDLRNAFKRAARDIREALS